MWSATGTISAGLGRILDTVSEDIERYSLILYLYLILDRFSDIFIKWRSIRSNSRYRRCSHFLYLYLILDTFQKYLSQLCISELVDTRQYNLFEISSFLGGAVQCDGVDFEGDRAGAALPGGFRGSDAAAEDTAQVVVGRRGESGRRAVGDGADGLWHKARYWVLGREGQYTQLSMIRKGQSVRAGKLLGAYLLGEILGKQYWNKGQG